MGQGFYKRRRGVLEHIEAGLIDLLEDGIHDYLSLKANLVIGSPCSIPVGVCFTSAPAIHAHCKRVSERTIQRCLERLETIGWLKTWKTPGKRGNYPTLLCRASVHDLSGNEYRINGEKTTDWRHPVYEPVGEISGSCRNSVHKLSGNRELRKEKGEKREEKTHPKGDDAVLVSPLEQARQRLLKSQPPEEAPYIECGLEVIQVRAHNLGIKPGSTNYYLTAYHNLKNSDKDWETVERSVQNPLANDHRRRVNALILRAEEESNRTGRNVIDCFHDLRQDPHCYKTLIDGDPQIRPVTGVF
jgi:hypothetical protein